MVRQTATPSLHGFSGSAVIPSHARRRDGVSRCRALAGATCERSSMHVVAVSIRLYPSLEIMKKHQELWKHSRGVVHSFTGTVDEAKAILQLGLDIGERSAETESTQSFSPPGCGSAVRIHHVVLSTKEGICASQMHRS